MKKLLLLVPFAFIACNNGSNSDTTPDTPDTPETAQIEETQPAYEIFGDSTITADGALTTEQFLAQLEGADSLMVKVEGPVVDVCQKKGCWMEMKLADGQNMTVRFKDYEFFVPMNSPGKTAVIEGVAKVETQDVNWLKHKASDAGKSQEEIDAITEPVTEVTFMANGVIIKG
ncbi:MAG: hypothetical protein SchgKO_18700 [Schleiferiaceae bacterium]